ncbi:MAG: purine-binding chemotaxis protein CheW [Candidatus Sericytochromatia bacterium]|nr:purine-binding chemotaxis protein CheW [Candidatus Sericytochromatia bacterium]
MENTKYMLILKIDEENYALSINDIDRTIQALEITKLPDTPPTILGVINYHGQIIPVINMRKLFNLPEKEIDLTDIFVIANTSKRKLCLVVDGTSEVIKYSQKDVVDKSNISKGLKPIKELINHEGNILLIYDLDSFISLEEDEVFEKAMNK